MISKKIELWLSQILAVGGFFTTVFVISAGVTDPVNVTKFLSLGITGGSVLGLLVYLTIRKRFSVDIPLIVLASIFLASSFMSIFRSPSPIVQNLYGAYGRNNGFFTYLFLMILLFGAAVLRSTSSHSRILKGLVFAGCVNVVYCLWVILFGDFIGWNNIHGNILGTFGNPNFVGSFLGIFFSVVFAYGLDARRSLRFRFLLVPALAIVGYVIVDSSAIQGRVVAAAGSGLVLFYFIRSRFSLLAQATFSIFASCLGILGIAGALQHGPFSEFIYKTSVSLRGQYWLAGWNTGEMNPFFGSGMDAFGDWYRRARDIRAIELPGVDVVVNAAHNVPVDMFAFGGWPLFISYIGIMLLGAIAILRLLVRTKEYDFTGVSLSVAWIGYQIQSIISINQIGLAIWGWILTGALISYEKCTRRKISDPKVGESRSTEGSKEKDSGQLIVITSAFALVGFLIALPPISADVKWRSAQASATVTAIENSMLPSLFNPQNTVKYSFNIQALERSGLNELSHRYALEATSWNSESYDLWKLLYLIQNSTPEEKALALKNMKRLDPLNPDVTKPR
jgi:hypothetical protein